MNKRVGCRLKKKFPDLTTNPFEAPDWDYGHKTRNFRRITDIHNLREALRTRITYYHYRQYNEMLQVDNTFNEREASNAEAFTTVVDPLATKWQDEHLRTAMSKLEQLQAAYQATAKLQKEAERLVDTRMVTNMRIIYFENDLARFTLFQNFQYILKEPDWREKHDWIHRKPIDGTLENYRESIEKRATLNIRPRDNDDAFLVREFFQTKYLPKRHSILLPFETTKDFMDIVEYIKMRTYRALLELHQTMWLQAETEKKHNEYQVTSSRDLHRRKETVERRCQKKYFHEGRGVKLKKKFKQTEEEVLASLKSKTEIAIEPVAETILLKFMPKNDETMEAMRKLTVSDKISRIETMTFELMHTLDDLPPHIIDTVEHKIRSRREFQLRQAQRTCELEHQMEVAMKGLKKNMEPPFKKSPRTGRLPISKLPPPPEKPPPEPPVPTLREQIFVEAFTDRKVRDVDIGAKDSQKILQDIERSCMPFYYDYFLEKNFGYHAEKEFVTVVERREGPEENRFKYKDVLPTVMKRIAKWERQRDYVKQYNISQTKYLYKIERGSMNKSAL